MNARAVEVAVPARESVGGEAGAATRSRQRAHWDALARTMPDLFPAASTQYYQRCEIALVRRTIGSLAGQRVLKLDLWNEAFNTRILPWMRDQGARAFGLDVSWEITARAQRNHDDLRLAQADIRHLPWANDAFDFVYTMGTIEHIDEYQAAVDEVFRVLRPGGKAIIGVPHKWNIFLRPLLVWVLQRFDKYPYSPEKAFSARELRAVVTRSGFVVSARSGVLTIPGIVRMADLFCFRRNISLHRLTPFALWPFEVLETRFAWPGRFGYLLALVVEKPVGPVQRM